MARTQDSLSRDSSCCPVALKGGRSHRRLDWPVPSPTVECAAQEVHRPWTGRVVLPGKYEGRCWHLSWYPWRTQDSARRHDAFDGHDRDRGGVYRSPASLEEHRVRPAGRPHSGHPQAADSRRDLLAGLRRRVRPAQLRRRRHPVGRGHDADGGEGPSPGAAWWVRRPRALPPTGCWSTAGEGAVGGQGRGEAGPWVCCRQAPLLCGEGRPDGCGRCSHQFEDGVADSRCVRRAPAHVWGCWCQTSLRGGLLPRCVGAAGCGGAHTPGGRAGLGKRASGAVGASVPSRTCGPGADTAPAPPRCRLAVL